ncbi:MAG TPA: metallophosphoesterase family protein [Jatrophihabitans sp.]|jgi:calcineurin-like phosphoesterase family protein
MRYYTSDTHYGHQNIIRYCNRPYADVAQMNGDLVARATRSLAPGDELWHLGDVALGHLDETLTHLAAIETSVTLVAGNHDRCHPSNGKRAEGFSEVYRERCQLSELILTNTTLTLSNGASVRLSHFPYADPSLNGAEDRHGEVISDRFAPWRVSDKGEWLLCGHVHERWRQRGCMINVGVDAWGGNSVSEDTIIELIEAGPNDLPPLAWEPS